MHKRIRIARGDSSTQAFKDTVPEKGQPVYDTKDNKLYIGNGNNKLEDLSDITVSKAQDSIHADNATHAVNATNAIQNDTDPVTYSGLRKNSTTGVLTTTDNNIISTKKLLWHSDVPKSNLTRYYSECNFDNNKIKSGTTVLATYTGTLNSVGSTITYENVTYTYSLDYGKMQWGTGAGNVGFYVKTNDPYGESLGVNTGLNYFFIIPFRFQEGHKYQIEYLPNYNHVHRGIQKVFTFVYDDSSGCSEISFNEMTNVSGSAPYESTMTTFNFVFESPFVLWVPCTWKYILSTTSVSDDYNDPSTVTIKRFLLENMTSGTGTTLTNEPATFDNYITDVAEIIE